MDIVGIIGVGIVIICAVGVFVGKAMKFGMGSDDDGE